MRLLICAGGTGGGVYPALAVLKALLAHEENYSKERQSSEVSELGEGIHEVLWIGGEGGIEVDLLAREKIPFRTIPAAGVHGVGLRALPGNLWKIIKGYFSARRMIDEFQPQVIFFTGGYLAVPVAAAGRLLWPQRNRPRIIVYSPDIEPGLAIQLTARFSDQVMLTVEDSMKYFEDRSKLTVTGYPTRFRFGFSNQQKALEQFNLSPNLPTLLVFGGSKGARSINLALLEILPDLLTGMQVIHVCGQLDWPKIEVASRDIADNLKSRYHPFPYLYSEMEAAFSVADLVVSRAGAAVLGEFPLFGLPAILIPYPHAWRYQEVNANYLENRGAALVLQDHELNIHLYSMITKLMNDDQMRNEMSQAMSSLATPQASESIANILLRYASVPSPGRI